MKNICRILAVAASLQLFAYAVSCSNPASPILLDKPDKDRDRDIDLLPCETEGDGPCEEDTNPSGSPDPSNPPPPAELTCVLAASSQRINSGGSVTLSVSSNRQLSTASIDGSIVSLTSPQRTFKPTATKEYAASVTDTNGTTKDCVDVRVEVLPPEVIIPTCTLEASKTSINAGESITLTFASQNATSGSIDQTSFSGRSGSISVSPVNTFTYVGRVVGRTPQDKNTCERQITVNNPDSTYPTCSLVANDGLVPVGTSVTLTLTTTNARVAKLDGQEKRTTDVTNSITLTATKTVNAKTTFEGDAANFFGSYVCRRTVNVITKKHCYANTDCICPAGTTVYDSSLDVRQCRWQSPNPANGRRCIANTNAGLACNSGCDVWCRTN